MGFKLKNGAIFLHVPKTGGRFVTKFLNDQGLLAGPAGNQHDDVFRSLAPQNYEARVKRDILEFPSRLRNRLKGNKPHDWTTGPRPDQPTLNDIPYMFCFVRHPVSWIESYYTYTVQQNWYYWSSEPDILGFWHPNAVLNDLRSGSFNEFIEKLLRKRPGYVTEMFGWYTTSLVSFVGKQETLREDLQTVLDDLSLNYDKERLSNAPKVNASQDNSNKQVWDKDLKVQFVLCERAALKRYGYEA